MTHLKVERQEKKITNPSTQILQPDEMSVINFYDSFWRKWSIHNLFSINKVIKYPLISEMI